MSPRIPRCGVPFLGRVHSTITANGRVYSRCSPQARGNGHFWALRRPHPPIFWIHQVPSPGFTWFSPGFTRPLQHKTGYGRVSVHIRSCARPASFMRKRASNLLRNELRALHRKSPKLYTGRASTLIREGLRPLYGKGFDPYTGRATAPAPAPAPPSACTSPRTRNLAAKPR